MLYVALMGTKAARDVLADANLLQAAVWQEPALPAAPPAPDAAPVGPAVIPGSLGTVGGAVDGTAVRLSAGPELAAANENPVGTLKPLKPSTGAGSGGSHAAELAGTRAALEAGEDVRVRAAGAEAQPMAPAAHRGFLARARGVPAELLYAHARRHGRRIVFCGADS